MKKAYPFPPFYNFTLNQVFYYENYQDYIMDPKKFNIHQTSIFSHLREKLINFNLIFQVDPYYEVFPNFYHYLKFIPSKGMHGYIPSHKDSYGIFYSSENNDNPNNVLEIFNYLKQKIL